MQRLAAQCLRFATLRACRSVAKVAGLRRPLRGTADAETVFRQADRRSDPNTGEKLFTDTLWASDGTVGGTRAVKDFFGGADASVFDDFVFFDNAVFGVDGSLLIRSDGSSAGTAPLNASLTTGHVTVPSQMTIYKGALYFTGAAYNRSGYFLWKSDGTASGTVGVATLFASGDNSVTDVTTLGGKLYFVAVYQAVDASGHHNGVVNVDLFQSDGTASGTSNIALLSSNGIDIPDLTTFNGELIFGHNNSLGTDPQLYARTVGGSALLLKDFGAGGLSPSNFTEVGATLFFTATDSSHGAELWKTDGTAAGTVLVKDIMAGSGGRTPCVCSTSTACWCSAPTTASRATSSGAPTARRRARTGSRIWSRVPQARPPSVLSP